MRLSTRLSTTRASKTKDDPSALDLALNSPKGLFSFWQLERPAHLRRGACRRQGFSTPGRPTYFERTSLIKNLNLLCIGLFLGHVGYYLALCSDPVQLSTMVGFVAFAVGILAARFEVMREVAVRQIPLELPRRIQLSCGVFATGFVGSALLTTLMSVNWAQMLALGGFGWGLTYSLAGTKLIDIVGFTQEAP
jgi:hypothetical protein